MPGIFGLAAGLGWPRKLTRKPFFGAASHLEPTTKRFAAKVKRFAGSVGFVPRADGFSGRTRSRDRPLLAQSAPG